MVTLSASMILILSTSFVFNQLYSYSIYHFGINIYWYRAFTLSASMIFLLSTWFVLSQLYSYSIYHFGIDIYLISNVHFLCQYDFDFINLVSVLQSVIQLLYLSLWYWYLLAWNIHFVCWYDFSFINMVCVHSESVIQLPYYHFGIDIYWYQTSTLSEGMILLLST